MPEVQLVKGFYERPFLDGEVVTAVRRGPGHRARRPAADRPALPRAGGLVQPLAGEWAIRRTLFESLEVPTGYAVELAALVDTVRMAGIDAIAQVDLGRRAHRHQALRDLGAMATQVLAAASARASHRAARESVQLRQYSTGDGRHRAARPRGAPGRTTTGEEV